MLDFRQGQADQGIIFCEVDENLVKRAVNDLKLIIRSLLLLCRFINSKI